MSLEKNDFGLASYRKAIDLGDLLVQVKDIRYVKKTQAGCLLDLTDGRSATTSMSYEDLMKLLLRSGIETVTLDTPDTSSAI